MLIWMLILVNTTIFENFKKSIQNKQICIVLDFDIQKTILINAHVSAHILKYFFRYRYFYALHWILL